MIEFWGKVLLLAVIFDILFGEPPAFLHPVVWMGKIINLFVVLAPRNFRKIYGFFIVFFCMGITVLMAYAIELTGTGIPAIVIMAYFLKSSFSIRLLLISAIRIQRELEIGNIEKVRRDLKTFVGRDTSHLNKNQLASAVIESLAESFVDGILAPLFYFLLFGLAGALTYRMINTLDSMVGYKKEPFAQLGYAAARIDDLVNFVPARLSLIFIFVSSLFFGKPLDAIRTCMLDHNKTASPNSGWSMAAVSGSINVRLEKVGYHVLGSNYNDPESFHIRKTINIVGFSSFLVIAGIYLSEKIPLIA